MPLGVHAVVERRVPRLALVPRDQLQAHSPTEATDQQQQRQAKQHGKRGAAHSATRLKHNHEHAGVAHDEDAVRNEELIEDTNGEFYDDDMLSSEKQQLRLGERFLRMMAAMARLSRVPLDNHEDGQGSEKQPFASSHSPKQQSSQPSIALEVIVQRKEALALQRLSPHKPVPPVAATAAQSTGSPAKGAAAPLLVPVNAATEPLHPHLTFEISMLLPQPIDTRQSSLQSPIRRKQLRPRRRKRRRRRPREKRSFQTSHATWAPRASADYIQEHSHHDSRSSKLMEKFAQLKKVAEPSSHPQMAKSSSMPMLNERKYLYAFPPLNTSAVLTKNDPRAYDEDDEEDCDEENSNSDSDRSEGESEGGQEGERDQGEDQNARSENNEPTFSSFFTHSARSTIQEEAASHTYPRNEAAPPTFSITATPCDTDTSATYSSPPTTTMPGRKHPLFHQPAWISPELKKWLISSGMFQTKPRHPITR